MDFFILFVTKIKLRLTKNHKFGLVTPLLFQFKEQKMKQKTSEITKLH